MTKFKCAYCAHENNIDFEEESELREIAIRGSGESREYACWYCDKINRVTPYEFQLEFEVEKLEEDCDGENDE